MTAVAVASREGRHPLTAAERHGRVGRIDASERWMFREQLFRATGTFEDANHEAIAMGVAWHM
jgi:hypothetical protein